VSWYDFYYKADEEEDDRYEWTADMLGPGDSRAMFSTTFPGGLRLVVRKAFILKLEVDAIANAADERMAHETEVSRVKATYWISHLSLRYF